MSMSTYIIGFIPPDDKYQKMKKIYDACEEADIDLPFEVEEFFGGEPPSEHGMQLILDDEILIEYQDNDLCQEGYELDLSKLDKRVKILRFYNSW